MQVLQKWVFFIISASFLVLLLLPFAHSSHESQQQANSPKSNKHGVEKITPELSFEITVHGFLLWASMGFLMPVGILIIRMSNTEKCGRRLKVLFYFHVIVQVLRLFECHDMKNINPTHTVIDTVEDYKMLSVLLATAAAIMSIKFFDNSFNNKHRRIGVALYAIIWIQALIGLRRPERGSKRRTMWFFLHWVLGTGVSILGIINTYTGLHAYHKKTSRSVKLWTILLTAEVCLLAFVYLFQEKWDYMKKQGVVLGIEPVTSTGQANAPRDNQKDLNFPC